MLSKGRSCCLMCNSAIASKTRVIITPIFIFSPPLSSLLFEVILCAEWLVHGRSIPWHVWSPCWPSWRGLARAPPSHGVMSTVCSAVQCSAVQCMHHQPKHLKHTTAHVRMAPKWKPKPRAPYICCAAGRGLISYCLELLTTHKSQVTGI